MKTKCLTTAPCKNNGSCIPVYTNDSYTCECQEGYGGSDCQTGKDEINFM